MANIISNHNSSSSSNGTNYTSTNNNLNNASRNSSGIGSAGSEVQNLRDVMSCNVLNAGAETVPANYMIPTGGCVYDHIIAMMKGLDLEDDGIVLNRKIKAIETDFCNIVRDESMLCESMEYMNDKALGDGDTALKFALLFSSRNFDALAMKETKVRSAMLKILETNFINADAYREHDKNRLYNSITLLGEYYHRVRLADNAPITILGESLLNLLTREINDTSVVINTRLARLILSQITLNGEIMRSRHKVEIDQLLYHIRRHLIMQPVLTPKVKAMLLMVLDLFYSHFKHIGFELEAMYTDYLVAESAEDDGINNNSVAVQPQTQYQQQQESQSAYIEGHGRSNTDNTSQTNESPNDSFELQPTTKKWSEQVCEDSLCDIGFGEADIGSGDPYSQVKHEPARESSRNSSNEGGVNRQSRRSYQPRTSPRPLKHPQAANEDRSEGLDQYSSVGNSEDRDETKPLPSWRKTRFNRPIDGDNQNGRSRNQHRRYSASFDDDHHSVRSDGGNLRLYSIHDRRKHSQERYERNLGSNNYNSIVNSNWDQRDDRSERSYISNYERGNYKRGGRFHNRNTYDKPPRFQKQQQQQHHSPHGHQNKDNQKIHSETWRRSNTSINNSYQDENCAYNSNGPESNSRSSSRARTLPRPPKSQMEEGGRKSNASYRYSQSPARGGGAIGPRNFNSRYSSQSSLASEASSTFDRRQPAMHHQQRHRNFTRRSQPDIHQPNAENWQAQGGTKDETELVRNAQQTTKYMNYLSAQK
ncbi:GATA zinc finger domain-containing protein 14 [Scaptodrosophila lebanonensis]|uniref:GATA zinc finger domain-containing protein 14 n=1 Tax=Drosophila lebanonensis TaxID=7225 RepID=A0A6J2T794_DROLE|nr:GATA zinc finger domain-containing protein 14 [Scaptodrosophila lebanonensis]